MSLVVKNNPQDNQPVLHQQQAVKAKAEKLPPVAPQLSKAEKLKAIEGLTRSFNTEYETQLIQKLGKKTGVRLPCLVSGMPTFDETLMSCGGMPRGRVIEIYGPESSGKTTLALHFVGMAQRLGEYALFVDAEHALDPNYAKTLGVDVDNLVISQPDYGEQALEVVDAALDTRAFGVIVVDSVSALVPKAELEGDMGDSHMGLQARLMSQAMRKLVAKAHRANCLVIFINQVREKIGVMFGNPEVTTGGRALKFWSSVRLEVRRLSKTDGGEIKDEQGTHIGHKMRIKNVKNKVGPPFRETVVDLYYAKGFDLKADTITYAISIGAVVEGDQTKEDVKNGTGNGVPKGWYGFGGENYRRMDLTQEPLYAKIQVEAMARRDVMLAAAAKAATDSVPQTPAS
jgi:recombination protein RecA